MPQPGTFCCPQAEPAPAFWPLLVASTECAEPSRPNRTDRFSSPCTVDQLHNCAAVSSVISSARSFTYNAVPPDTPSLFSYYQLLTLPRHTPPIFKRQYICTLDTYAYGLAHPQTNSTCSSKLPILGPVEAIHSRLNPIQRRDTVASRRSINTHFISIEVSTPLPPALSTERETITPITSYVLRIVQES